VSDISSWFGQRRLEKYIERFAVHEIDWAVFPELEEDELKDIGLPRGPGN